MGLKVSPYKPKATQLSLRSNSVDSTSHCRAFMYVATQTKKIEALCVVMFDFSKLMTGLQRVVLIQILH